VSALPDVLPIDRLLDLTGRTIVVTGASGGIGAAIARRLAEAGATVVSHGFHAPPLPVFPPGHAIQIDLRADDGAERLAAFAVESTGRLDGWVNNAALQTVSPLLALDTIGEALMVDSNLGFVMRGTRAAAHARTIGDASGLTIVNIASIEGLIPAIGHSHYGAAKAGVLQHTKAAAAELGPLGIRVNAVAPGLIDRPGLIDDWPAGVASWTSTAPLRRLGTPDDVADACLFLCAPASRWITGATLVVDGGMVTRSPW
jgi:NAD(P)-dependent dehydrogenase (short-subunit alcohol dehydrogenase family)